MFPNKFGMAIISTLIQAFRCGVLEREPLILVTRIFINGSPEINFDSLLHHLMYGGQSVINLL